MTKLILDSTSTAQWHRLVTEAQACTAQQLDEQSESYLVFLLMRYLRSRELLRRVMALGYLHAMESSGRVQEERLRDVGDQCLMLAGLFPGQARRRRVGSDYFVDLGRSAYSQVQRNAAGGIGELYGTLAAQFLDLRDVLRALRAVPEPEGETLEAALRRMEQTASREPGTAWTPAGKIPGTASRRRH